MTCQGGKLLGRPADAPSAQSGVVVGHHLSPSLSGGSADKEFDDADLDESVDTESDPSALDVEPIEQPSLHQQLDSHGREVYPLMASSGSSSSWPAGPPVARLETNFEQVQSVGRCTTSYPLSDVERFMLNEGIIF